MVAKLEMDDFDRQWWLADAVSEEVFSLDSEVTHINNLGAIDDNTANELLI